MISLVTYNCNTSFTSRIPGKIDGAKVKEMRQIVLNAVQESGHSQTNITSKQLIKNNPGLFNGKGRVTTAGANVILQEYGASTGRDLVAQLSKTAKQIPDGDITIITGRV